MKTILSILFIAYVCNVYANNYGNQDSVSLTVRGTYGGTQTLLGLVHVPPDYNTDMVTKHPFIVFICGTGAYGTTQVLVQNEGMSNALYTGTWDGTAVNPKTGAKEEFITLSLQHPNSSTGIDGRQVDDAIGWLFSHYHGIDTTRGTVTGLSRGGGSTCGNLEHIYMSNPCTSWTFFHPVHNIPFFIPMSAENNACDPVDSVFIYNNHVWGFGGDATGCNDIHAVTTHNLCDNINKRKPNLAQFTSYYSAGSGCHSGWNVFYAASYTSPYKSDVYSYASISIYQAALLYSSSGNGNTGTGGTGNTISIQTISASSFCITSTTGSAASVSYTATGSFINGNIFQAQLSDASGNFTSGTTIGTITTTNASGTISCTIPKSTATGSGYRIRVNSTNPATTGSNNGTNLTINLTGNSIAPTNSQSIYARANGTKLTVTETSAPASRTWYYGTNSGGPYNSSTGITATTYTPNFSTSGRYYLVCKSVWSCATVQSNYVTINVYRARTRTALQNNEQEEAFSVQSQSDQQSAFSVQSQSDQIVCHYTLQEDAAIQLVIYDEYKRPRASFSVKQNAGTYMHTFNQHLPNGLYVVVLQNNQQKIASQKIVIRN
jgi:hypothetical protein